MQQFTQRSAFARTPLSVSHAAAPIELYSATPWLVAHELSPSLLSLLLSISRFRPRTALGRRLRPSRFRSPATPPRSTGSPAIPGGPVSVRCGPLQTGKVVCVWGGGSAQESVSLSSGNLRRNEHHAGTLGSVIEPHFEHLLTIREAANGPALSRRS